MWWTSGWAPVAIDERHTGVSDGNTVAVDITVPAGTPGGTDVSLTATVVSDRDPATTNSATVTLLVVNNRPPDCSLAMPSASTLWPANHTITPVSILGVSDPDGDTVTIQIDRVTQDEPTNGAGDGNTCPDALGLGTATAQLRAERSGTGNGRVYTIFFTATDGKGGICQGSVKAIVPHDQNSTAIEDSASFDSTACRP